MKILLGLGNPGKKHSQTRHNVGFWVLDECLKEFGGAFKHERKFNAEVAEVTIAGKKALLVKPHTYYNEVGQSARALLDFYKLASEDILVIHDDLALPLGTIRTRVGGSSGGNNGLKSLEQYIGQATARLRIGVWTDRHHDTDKVGVVLGKLSRDEQIVLSSLQPEMSAVIHDFINDALHPTTVKS